MAAQRRPEIGKAGGGEKVKSAMIGFLSDRRERLGGKRKKERKKTRTRAHFESLAKYSEWRAVEVGVSVKGDKTLLRKKPF